MDETVHADFARWARAQTFSTAEATRLPLKPGDVTEPVRLDPDSASRLVVSAAKLAAGFFRPTRKTVIVWVEGDSELAVEIGSVRIAFAGGRVDITLPVRCDQTGPAEVIVTFAVGSPDQPRGAYAATPRRPTGPQLIVDTWGEALVAFAWKVLLTLTTQLSGATGKDARGNLLIPADLAVNSDGLFVQPMARFRFAGGSGLTSKAGGARPTGPVGPVGPVVIGPGRVRPS